MTALRLKTSLRHSLVQAVGISEQGITLDMPSTTKHSALSMLAAQAKAMHGADPTAFHTLIKDCTDVIAVQLLPALLQPGAGVQCDASGLTVTHAAQPPATSPDAAWLQLQHTADAAVQLHEFLGAVFCAEKLGDAVTAHLAGLWDSPCSRPSIARWLQAAVAGLPWRAFEYDTVAAAALRHVASARAVFLGEGVGTCDLLPTVDSPLPATAIAAKAASCAVFAQVHSVYAGQAGGHGRMETGLGELPSLPEAGGAASHATPPKAAHEVQVQATLAALGGSSPGGRWLEPIQGPSMLCRPSTVCSKGAERACTALAHTCRLLHQWREEEQAAITMCQCLMQIPLVAKAGCLSRAAGGSPLSCLQAVSDLGHLAYASTVCTGDASHTWEDIPTACAEILARAPGVLDELRGGMVAQLQQAVLLMARQLRAAVAPDGNEDSVPRAVQRGIAYMTEVSGSMATLLLETPRVAVTAHLLACLLSCVWNSVGESFQEQTPATQRALQAALQQWCGLHAPSIDFSQLLEASQGMLR